MRLAFTAKVARLRFLSFETMLVAMLWLVGPLAIAADEGDGIAPEIAGSITGVSQQANAGGVEEGERTSRANDRVDVTLTLSGGRMGDVEGKLFAHFRAGQGIAVALRPTYTSTPNATAFAGTSAGDAYAIVAEAWYQLSESLPRANANDPSHRHLDLTFGKMDPFAFFDQNGVADDETMRFLNNAFVHNPLLDSGGDTRTDRYGFAPGARVAYAEEGDEAWRISIAAFGSGPAADFHGSLAGPFVVAQIETTRRFASLESGSYRAYAWTNGRTVDFEGRFERHTGVGFSIDQPVTDAITLWGRFGAELAGDVRFDRALTLGAEIAGRGWAREDDAIGVATGFLRTSNAYRDATRDASLVGYAAAGTEGIVETYYRLHVNKRLDVSPDLQWIRRPGGNGSAPDIVIGGVRARIGF
ncbi:MAG TPA: carbohydrate porin [Casimicrobiaceae bacterium]|nr:carbohydrate porin [Casimicrobiaceae bacterium]